MNNEKIYHAIPLALISVACVLASANLATHDKEYGGFMFVGCLTAYWASVVLRQR